MTRTLKATGNNFRIVPLAELDQADALCSVCNVRPRGAGGRLSKCLECLRHGVQLERDQREARARAREEAENKAPPATKACRTCKLVKPLSSFAKHRLAKDGHRHDCAVCVKTERTKRAERTAEQREAQKVNAAQPHRRAANRRAVAAWAQRNPQAIRARSILRRAVKSGRVQIAEHCQADGCTTTQRLHGHHHDYLRPLAVTWLCSRHHHRAHASGVLKVKRGVRCWRPRIPKLK